MTEEILTSGASLALADSYYVEEEYELAIDAYAAALSVLRETDRDVKFRALSHKAAALLHLGRYSEACEDAQIALADVPPGLRSGETEICNFRLGLSLYEMGRFEEAKNSFERVKQLASLNKRPTERYEKFLKECEKELEEPPVVVEEIPPRKAPETKAPPTAKSPIATVAASSSIPTPVAAAPQRLEAPRVVSVSSTNKQPAMPKYQYYQSEKVMTIAILEPNVQQEDLHVEFSPKRLTVQLRKQGVEFTVIAGRLHSEIDPSKSKTVIKDEKVLIKLRKESAFEWHELLSRAKDEDEDEAKKKDTPDTEEIPTVKAGKTRAYASHRDWDAIERDIKEKEKSEKPEGDEALNMLFKNIYGNADEDTRRAMIKSYQTSGGTVLSTNWDEVSKKDYEKERTAPKGMEWKTWEGDKVAGDDDDKND